jgi:hypothetical protein
MATFVLTINGKPVEVPEDVYVYVKQLEAYIKHPDKSKLLEVYPHLNPDKPAVAQTP